MKKTKIVCTMGPATKDVSTIREMMKAGMNLCRVNMSHGTYKEHAALIAKIKKVREELKLPVGIILDTKGPEVRVKTFENGSAVLKKNAQFVLTSRNVAGNSEIVSITYNKLGQQVKKNQKILLDDGNIELCVVETNKEDIVCKVIVGGTLKNNKSINLPGCDLHMKYLSDVDKLDMLFGIQQDVDYIAISFVSSVKDVKDVRNFLVKNGAEHIKLISKIESEKGVANIDEIIDASDAVMVARGDMGVEIDFKKIPHIQKTIVSKCVAAGKPVIIATQMLESMQTNARPTRAEISDVANAVFDGSDSIMLSGETAVGEYPVLTVKVMAQIAAESEKDVILGKMHNDVTPIPGDVSDNIAYATVAASFTMKSKAILVVTLSGITALSIAKFRPDKQIVACTPTVSTYNQLSLVWGVDSVLCEVAKNTDKLLQLAKDSALQAGYVKKGDVVVQTVGMPIGNPSNTIRIENV